MAMIDVAGYVLLNQWYGANVCSDTHGEELTPWPAVISNQNHVISHDIVFCLLKFWSAALDNVTFYFVVPISPQSCACYKHD